MLVGSIACSCGRHLTGRSECGAVTYGPALVEGCSLLEGAGPVARNSLSGSVRRACRSATEASLETCRGSPAVSAPSSVAPTEAGMAEAAMACGAVAAPVAALRIGILQSKANGPGR